MDKDIEHALSQGGVITYFNALPPSHKHEYIQWITAAKQAATRARRIAKMIEMLKAAQQG